MIEVNAVDRGDDRDDLRADLARRARDRRYLRAGETWDSETVDLATRLAALDELVRDHYRRMAALLQNCLAMIADWRWAMVVLQSSWNEPLPVPSLVSQFVADLDIGPAPPRPSVASVAA